MTVNISWKVRDYRVTGDGRHIKALLWILSLRIKTLCRHVISCHSRRAIRRSCRGYLNMRCRWVRQSTAIGWRCHSDISVWSTASYLIFVLLFMWQQQRHWSAVLLLHNWSASFRIYILFVFWCYGSLMWLTQTLQACTMTLCPWPLF